MLRVVSANVNGIRAAARRGGLEWLRAQAPDVICLQEVRADRDVMLDTLAVNGFGDWFCVHAPAAEAGRAGVAILATAELTDVRIGLGKPEFAEAGRWIDARIATSLGSVSVASCYVHTGEAGTGRQQQKYRFLRQMERRLAEFIEHDHDHDHDHALVAGDLNIARSELDIKNWRGNVGKAGFLPTEQRYLDRWFASDWVDVARVHCGEKPGPYTWWSWRGQAFDNDAGWRIDYVMASTGLARGLTDFGVGRASSYAKRWSDHAPLIASFGPAPID